MGISPIRMQVQAVSSDEHYSTYSDSDMHQRFRQNSLVLSSGGKKYLDRWYLLSSSNCNTEHNNYYHFLRIIHVQDYYFYNMHSCMHRQ